jgi:hypothetical protein
MSRAPEEHLCWPPERFYWAVVEGAPWRGAGVVPPGILALAEDDLPIDSGALHAVGIAVPGGVLLCAAAAEELAGLDDAVLSLRPSEVPAGIDAEMASLNLLVGPHEPRALRRARERRHLSAAMTVVACGLLVSVGLARRAAHWSAAATSAQEAWTTAALAHAPGSEPSMALFDLRRLADRMDGAGSARPPPDAALALAGLLERWPAGVASKPQSIAVRASEVSVSVLVADAPAFLAAMTPPEGWTMSPPMLNTSGDQTRLTLTFQRPPQERGV